MQKKAKLHPAFKILGASLLLYSVIGGLLMPVPRLNILNETIRNLYYHVPLWFAMTFMFLVAFLYSLRYLKAQNPDHDRIASEAIYTGILFGLLGLGSGMLWANYTWGTPWTNDPQLNSAAIVMLIYLAYTILRSSVQDQNQKAKLASVYTIFAFCLAVPLLFILPRMSAGSLHPGKGGNPGFNSYDLDSNMRLVFYPAVLAWIFLGLWITDLRVRYRRLKAKR